jgi:abhydrolase domain-containing protein 17
MMKQLLTLCCYALAVYLAFSVVIYFFANSLIYFPPRPSSYTDSDNFNCSSDNHCEMLKLKTRDGHSIAALYLPNSVAEYTILVSHGNAEDLGYMLPFLSELRRHGFAVIAYDYYGYGHSEGKPSERHCYFAIDAVYDYLTKELVLPPQRIILYGRSLGAAVALDLAVRQPAAALIMESAFMSAYRIVTRVPIFPFDQFNNLRKIKKLTLPLLMLHGERDEIAPFWHGQKLYEVAGSSNGASFAAKKAHLWEAAAGHNDVLLVAQERYWKAINDFVRGL